MIRTIAILVLLAATAAHAQLTTTVKRIRLENATAAELAGTTLDLGHAVFNEENLADLRIGDGATPGGVRVGSDWWTNNMLKAWGGLSRVEVEALVALSIPYGVNDAESSRIRLIPSPLAASGTVTFAASTTNLFVRPDGGTNTIRFDADGNMIVAVDGTTALTVRTNGNVGIKNAGSSTYPMVVSGDIVASGGRVRALDFRDSAASTYFLDPNGESSLASIKMDGSLTVTQGVSRIILPSSTNGLVSGTLWNDAGTVKVMP